MKILCAKGRGRGFTLVEMLVVTAVVVVLFVVFVPELIVPHRRMRHGPGITCMNNLKQIGLSFRTWDGDYNDLYPMSYYTNADGSMKYADPSNFFRYFQVMSNELNNPAILACPADAKVTRANDFTNLSGANISYFVGLDADERFPTRFLAGDRNLTNGMVPRNGILELTTNGVAGWTPGRHPGIGYVGLADGSVQMATSVGLNQFIARTGLAKNRIGLP